MSSNSDQIPVRTTGRIKKPKAVFDPSDNYLPRSYRSNVASTATSTTTTTSALAVPSPTTNVERDRKKEAPLQASAEQSSSSSDSMSSTPSNVPSEVCSVCNKTETKRSLSTRSKLIACTKCDKKTHRQCMKIDYENIDKLRPVYKCEACSTCFICEEAKEAEAKSNVTEIITCVKCAKSYHLDCHIPNVLAFLKLQRGWKCNKCASSVSVAAKTAAESPNDIAAKRAKVDQRQPEAKGSANTDVAENKTYPKNKTNGVTSNGIDEHKTAAAEAGKSTSPPAAEAGKSASPRAAEAGKSASSRAAEAGKSTSTPATTNFLKEPIEIPDVRDWSVDQVTEFFTKYFPNEAYIFSEFEIDGMSLLMLTRNDIIKKMPNKLGVLLRIYSLVLMLQSQVYDVTLGWNN